MFLEEVDEKEEEEEEEEEDGAKCCSKYRTLVCFEIKWTWRKVR